MISFKEFKTVCSAGVAGPQKGTNLKNTALPSTSLTPISQLSNASAMYNFITETYRDLQSYISGLHQDLKLIETINKYKNGCSEVYTKALESYSMCYQLAQNIVRTMDIFKELCTCLPDLEEYNYRLCEIISIFIAYELRLGADATQQEQVLIAQRIIYIMRRHLVQEEEHETSLNILRTLVYIPKLFNARGIMCAIFSEFIAIKPVPEVKVFPDKIYMLYIIVFFRWMMMQEDNDDKQLIVNFAESFMKPSVSLCSNNLYGAYLPLYSKHSTATRTILNNLKFYADIRNACVIDNAYKNITAVVNLCDDDEDDIIFVDTPSSTDFAQTFAATRLEPLSDCMSSVKLEEKTVIDTVDLTAEDESLSCKTSINQVHDKWLNDFQNSAKQYRESQLLLEKQNTQLVSNNEKQTVICLDSDSEEELVEVSTVAEKEILTVETNKENSIEDGGNKKKSQEELFVGNYPLSNLSVNSDSELDADDENDDTKISAKFMPSNLRTYQAKKPNFKSDEKNNFGANQPYTLQETNKIFRRDSVHISSTPPDEEDEEDAGTDVQDENDDNDPKDDEHQPYTFLPKANKIPDVKPMGPYPTYNSVHNDKVVFSQSVPSYSLQSVMKQYDNSSQLKSVLSNSQQQQHCPDKQDKSSDNYSEIKVPKKQKKVVRFNTNIEGPTLHQTRYKVSDAPDFYHSRGCRRFSRSSSIDSVSTTSSTKQQERNTNSIDDDTIFKKLTPVTKPLKIEKVVALRKRRDSLKTKVTDKFNVKCNVKLKKINLFNGKRSTITGNKLNLVKTLDAKSNAHDADVLDGLSKLSIVTENINENENLSEASLDFFCGEYVQANRSREKEGATEEATNLKNDKIVNLSKTEVSANEIKRQTTTPLIQSNKTGVKNDEATPNLNNLVKNFSAEFLACLPNKPCSASSIDAKINASKNKNEIDFEFEINCSTLTKCRIDLDAIAMPISECEDDKLLKEFNHKSKDGGKSSAVKENGSDNLNETERTAEAKVLTEKDREPNNKSAKYSKIIQTSQSETTKRANSSLTPRKYLLRHHDNEPNSEIVCDTSTKILKRVRENDVSNVKEHLNVKLVKKLKKENEHKTSPSTAVCLSEQITSNNSEKYKTKQITLGLKKNKNSGKAHKNSKLSNNLPNDDGKFQRNSGISSKESTLKVKSSGDIAKLNNNSNIEANNPRQMKTYFNEDQPIALEVGNRQKERKSELKANHPEAGSVSAIFSFPKIPVIAIPIHTTPNNKSSFKISNSENDKQTKESVNTKNIKSPQQENDKGKVSGEKILITASVSKTDIHTESDGAVKVLKSSPICRERVLEHEKETVKNTKENKTKKYGYEEDHNSEKCNLKECEVIDNGDNGDREIENIEIEKYSHDSNSTSSLPLIKRLSQAENSCGTDDSSQKTGNVNYDQPQEIGAEVVIENTCEEDKPLSADNTLLRVQQGIVKPEEEINKDDLHKINHVNDVINNNKSFTSTVCFKHLCSSFNKRGVHTTLRPSGQTIIQILVPQLKKKNFVSPNRDHKITDTQTPSVSRMSAQSFQRLPESYPATPMLSVANVEKLMDLNRFIEDLLASPDVISIIDNANACDYFDERQAYELERIAILEHFNIANAKGSTTVTKPLYYKKSAIDTISIFNDNSNDWISLPPSTAKQIQKLSFVLSILQQQYKVSDVRQRINIALAFLIRNTSKFMNTLTSNTLQQSRPFYSRNITDLKNSNHNNPQPALPSSSHFRIAANNATFNNTNFSMNLFMENAPGFHFTNNSNNQLLSELSLQQEPTGVNNQNWNNSMYSATSTTTTPVTEQTNLVNSPQSFNNSSNMETVLPSHLKTPDKRCSSGDEINTDQLYINPPLATSPQNEVIVNTNGVELVEIPQDPHNVFISTTDESGTTNAKSSAHKYNIRQQQQNRVSEDLGSGSLSSSRTQQTATQRCLAKSTPSIPPNKCIHHNGITTFKNQEINLQNSYGVQKHFVNTNPNSNFSERNMPQQNSSSSTVSQSHLKCQQQAPSRFSSLCNTQLTDVNSQQRKLKSKESNFKEILQPYITYVTKEHEKTSKYLLQVSEKVSNSDTSTMAVTKSLNENKRQKLDSLQPPLMRNPQQNHLPCFQQSAHSDGSILSSLIRNSHQNSLINRDSGTLQVSHSLIEQSKTDYKPFQQQIASPPLSVEIPGFAKEFINFVATQEKLRLSDKTIVVDPLDTQRLRNVKKELIS